jgi:hypothetical protein
VMWEAHISVLNPDFFADGRVENNRLPLGVSSLSIDEGARMCSLRRV